MVHFTAFHSFSVCIWEGLEPIPAVIGQEAGTPRAGLQSTVGSTDTPPHTEHLEKTQAPTGKLHTEIAPAGMEPHDALPLRAMPPWGPFSQIELCKSSAELSPLWVGPCCSDKYIN